MAELQQRLQAAVGDTYRIEKELGGGGMSRVFLAEEVRLGRKVVIKVLPPEMGAGVNVERFEREIQLAAKLQHPHVVPLLTAGSSDDLLYYMMPFIEGESLRAKLAREGELPVGDAVRILKEVVDALAYAHEHGVVHRDIKPDNVLLSGKHAVVTDFGVAKAVSASTGESNLTSLGVALGTPAYMAPEQAVADPHVDHRADIYAVGAMAYEMLTGRPPFMGPNPQAVLSAHVTDAPEPATKFRTTVPESLNALVMRCLEKKAADRWQKAEELLPHLDSILTPTGGITPTGTQPVPAVDYEALARQAHPIRVAALFGLGSAVALALVYWVMIQTGLPDWVFVGAVILLVIGLPIMVMTGHHERQRALASTTGAVVTTPQHGIRRLFTWRKSLMGGGLAFAGLGVVAMGYMAMRLLGIGPAATLVTSGVLEERGRLIMADFENRTADSGLGTSVTEAFRVDLEQSPVVRLMDGTAIGQSLQRMNRDPGTPVDLALAQEIAEREGVKAIVSGDIGTLGRGFVLSARLLSTTDGSVLVSLRETADDDAEIIGAVDQLSAKLRERIGESLKTIRSGEPLEQVTTSSLEALRLYSRGVNAGAQADYERSIQLLEEAVAVDTAFAMAYRKLAVILGNAGAEQSRIVDATAQAFEHQDRLPPLERYLTTAYYYSEVDFDRSSVVAAYRSVLEIDPDELTALNNLALELREMRQYAEAESLLQHSITVSGGIWQNFAQLASALQAQGKSQDATAAMDAFAAQMPDNPNLTFYRAQLAVSQGEYEAGAEYLEQLAEAERESPTWQRRAHVNLARVDALRGKIAAAERRMAGQLAAYEDRDVPSQVLNIAIEMAGLDVHFRDDREAAIRRVESKLEQVPLDSISAPDRPYLGLMNFFAEAGQPERARQLWAEWERELDEGLRRGPGPHLTEGNIALAEGRAEDAVAGFRAFYSEVGCGACSLYQLGRAFEMADEADSALAVYKRAVSVPDRDRLFADYRWMAQTYKRLGELHEERRETEKAVEYYDKFVELWKDTDPELQPVVQDVRGRIARLVGER